MKILCRLWSDECGVVQPAQMILLFSVLTIGTIVALATLRDQVIQSFGDTAVALESLNQSYSFTVPGATSVFVDTNPLTEPVDAEPAGIDLTNAAGEEM